MAYNSGSPMHGFNPWVVSVDPGANARRTAPRTPASVAENARQGRSAGLLKRFLLLLQRI